MLKVHVLFEHSSDLVPHATSMLRLIRPLTHPSAENSIELTYSTSFDGVDADVIFVDRLWKPDINLEEARKLIQYTHNKSISLIYSLDDNLLDLGNDLPRIQQPITPGEKNVVRYFIRESNGVIVTTIPLSERIHRLNPNIVIVPNILDERLCPIPYFRNENYDHSRSNNRLKTQKDGKCILGYMGTMTHDRDLSEVLPALRYILSKYHDTISFEIVGGLSDKRLLHILPGLTELNPKGNVEYTRFWPWMQSNMHWDLAIAPLEKSSFTVCKSDIKFLDYSALGIPAVYTQYDPYQSTIVHGKTGFLVPNETEAWIHALESLIFDTDFRFDLKMNAQDYVFNNRVLVKYNPLKEAVINLYERGSEI